jgi:pimeloyl-ACP methyl ester carboxylesterase
MPPVTRYAKSGDLRIAYQVVGDGPFDLVFVPGFVSNIELIWERPEWANFFSRLAGFSRLILFDKRGTGLSDRIAGIANLEERMDDVRAVMDAGGSERAALFGISEGGPMCLLFAATYPHRVQGLVLYGSYARHPLLTSEDVLKERIEVIDRAWGDWGVQPGQAPTGNVTRRRGSPLHGPLGAAEREPLGDDHGVENGSRDRCSPYSPGDPRADIGFTPGRRHFAARPVRT